jgi:hypothetical protein
MSRHYNTQHPERGRSHYPDRLSARGLTKAPTMPKVEDLRKIQEARQRRTGSPFPTKVEQEAA